MSNRRESGFSLIELLIVIVVLGVMATMGVPRVRGALLKQNVRSARVAAVSQVVKARSVAVQRGCRGVVHLRDTGAIWVTACQTTGAGVDTLGSVDNLRDRYGVTLSSTRDSVQFDPRGLSVGNQSASIVVANAVATETISINAIGRVTQ